jgi:hypothetical protein
MTKRKTSIKPRKAKARKKPPAANVSPPQDGPEDVADRDIHTEDCCRTHGCKHDNPCCSVVTRTKRPDRPCSC